MSKLDLARPAPTRLQNIAVALKELKYEIQESPLLFSALGTAYAIITVEMYRISPLLCVGVHAVTTYPSLFLAAHIIPSEANTRKKHHQTLTFCSIRNGDFQKVTEYASQNQYGQSDQENLEEQNTEFLFEALDQYNGCFGYTTFDQQSADNYLQAAEIFIKHHADVKKVKEILSKYYMPKASKWLLDNAPEHK